MDFDFEALDAALGAVAPSSSSSSEAPAPETRLLLLTSATQFIFEGSRISTAEGVRQVEIKWDQIPTGANRASFALFRHLATQFPRTTIAAFDVVDKTLADGELHEEVWEGFRVHRGKPNSIGDLVRKWPGGFDVALAASIRFKGIRLLEFVEGAQHFAMVHTYETLPFGPWAARKPEAGEKQGADRWWADVLSRTTLLCPSQAVVEYCQRWWPRGAGRCRAQVSYAADYHYFNSGGAEPLAPDYPQFKPWEPQHRYVTAVSPCEVKGIAVLMALAARLPGVQFMAVATSWTRPQHRLLLSALPNVRVELARPVFGELLAMTKVLLVPSLWAEAFGLVCMEAALHGIPVLSTNHGGLKEANVLRECVVPSRMVASLRNYNVAVGLTLEEYEQVLVRSEDGDDGDDDDVTANVSVLGPLQAAPFDKPPVPQFARLIEKILAEETFLKSLSLRAARQARGLVAERRGQLMAELRVG